jgi:hypothetical protein
MGAFASINSGLESCAKIQSDNQRLKCFDHLVQQHSKIVTTREESKASVLLVDKIAPTVSKIDKTPVVTKVVKAPKVTKDVDNFSKQHLKKTKEERGPDSINAIISKVKKLLRGQWVIYLENGQKWQQTDAGKIKLKVGDKIRLKKGSIGAVYLSKEGVNRNIRVKRLK